MATTAYKKLVDLTVGGDLTKVTDYLDAHPDLVGPPTDLPPSQASATALDYAVLHKHRDIARLLRDRRPGEYTDAAFRWLASGLTDKNNLFLFVITLDKDRTVKAIANRRRVVVHLAELPEYVKLKDEVGTLDTYLVWNK